jgi:adenylate cyclase
MHYGYDFIGDQTVKNIAKPVGAYRFLVDPRVTISGKPEKKKASGFRRVPILAGVAAAVILAVTVGIWQFYSKSLKVDSPSVEKTASTFSKQPSIAVLPFTNMTNDPEQFYIISPVDWLCTPTIYI